MENKILQYGIMRGGFLLLDDKGVLSKIKEKDDRFEEGSNYTVHRTDWLNVLNIYMSRDNKSVIDTSSEFISIDGVELPIKSKDTVFTWSTTTQGIQYSCNNFYYNRRHILS